MNSSVSNILKSQEAEHWAKNMIFPSVATCGLWGQVTLDNKDFFGWG